MSVLKTRSWSFGSNRLQIEADVRALRELQDVVATDTPSNDFWATSSSSDTAGAIFPGGLNVEGVLGRQRERKQLLSLLLESEVNRLDVWSNPLGDNRSKDHPTPALKALTDVRFFTCSDHR